jgi:predicted RNase H-like HicB family nuclease
MTLKAIVHKAEEGGFWAEVPALPGCVTQGETAEEVRSNLQDAIKLWLEAGEPLITESDQDQILELAL